jgi:oligoribonuclease
LGRVGLQMRRWPLGLSCDLPFRLFVLHELSGLRRKAARCFARRPLSAVPSAAPMAEKIVRKQDEGNLAWLDLEMTGLDPQSDVILQAALIVTNRNLEPLEEYSCDIWQPEAELAKMVPFVREMHERNGLVERVRQSKLEIGAAEKRLFERVAGWCPYQVVLCGNSIGQDKRFVERYMPGLAGYLSYRIVDVSSIKVLARLWHGDGAVYKKPAEGEHDALVDVRNSIAELRHYRTTVFKK